MQTIIFCNGASTALEPITSSTPLPLCKVVNKPIIYHILDNLCANNISSATLILPNKSGQFLQSINDNYKNMEISFYVGDGMSNLQVARRIWSGGDVLCVDGNVLGFFDISGLTTYHKKKASKFTAVTGTVANPCDNAVFTLGNDEKITNIQVMPNYENCSTNFAFAGVYIISKEIISQIALDKELALETDYMDKLCKKNEEIYAFMDKSWFKRFNQPSDFLDANQALIKGVNGFDISHLQVSQGVFSKALGCLRGVSIIPPVYIGKNVSVGYGSVIESGTILCDNATIGRSCHIVGSYVGSQSKIGDNVSMSKSIVCRNSGLAKGVECDKMTVIGAQTQIGENTIVKEGIKIWDGKRISPNITVTSDVKEYSDGEIHFDEDGIFSDISGIITPMMASVFGASAGTSVKKGESIAIGYSGNTNAPRSLAKALISGISSSGVKVWWLGNCCENQMFFAMKQANSRLGIIVNSDYSASIKVFAEAGLPLTRQQEKNIETAVNSHSYRQVNFDQFGEIGDGKSLKELYVEELIRILPERFDGINIRVRTTNPKIAEIADKLFYPRNDLSGEEITVHINPDGRSCSAYTEKTGYVFHEKLVMVAAKDNFAMDYSVAVPYTFPDAIDRYANKYQGTVLRYYHSPIDNSDLASRSNAVLSNNIFVRDALCLTARIASMLSRERQSLSRLLSDVPEFYSSQRFIAVNRSITEILKNLDDDDQKAREGIVCKTPTSKAVVRPLKSGKGIMIFAEGFKAEMASSLCDDIEKKIKNIDNI